MGGNDGIPSPLSMGTSTRMPSPWCVRVGGKAAWGFARGGGGGIEVVYRGSGGSCVALGRSPRSLPRLTVVIILPLCSPSVKCRVLLPSNPLESLSLYLFPFVLHCSQLDNKAPFIGHHTLSRDHRTPDVTGPFRGEVDDRSRQIAGRGDRSETVRAIEE